jgi:hypothetical protein
MPTRTRCKPLSLQILVDARRGEGGIGPGIDTPDPAAIPQDDPLEHTAVGAMDLPGRSARRSRSPASEVAE